VLKIGPGRVLGSGPYQWSKDMAEKKPVEKAEKAAGFVVMKRDPEVYPAPHEVAVPVSEVENYKAGGYEPA